jgi:hypothetical protein
VVDKLVYSDRIVISLRSAVKDGWLGLEDVPDLIKKILRESLWRERVIQKTGELVRFESFVDFVKTKPLEGLGADVSMLQRMCGSDIEALD